MNQHLIIVAAGSGKRMGTSVPKQFIQVHGKPILVHTIEKFLQYNPVLNIIVVLQEGYHSYWNDLLRTMQINLPHTVIAGGAERFHSVQNGLKSITDLEGVVAIHDAVRPLVSASTIERCFQTAASKGNAIPCINVADSLRITEGDHNKIIDRTAIRLVQTPQCFEINLLRNAFEQPYQLRFTDDASVVEAMGEKINLVEGNKENIKLTEPVDILMAEALLLGAGDK